MTALHIVTTMPYTTALPRDCSITTRNFRSDDPDADAEVMAAAVFALVTAFYNATQTSGGALAQYHGGIINRPLCTHEAYLVPPTEGPLGDPIATETWTLAAQQGGSYPLPLEVAVCTSQSAADLGGINIARRRGRQYIGPLNTGAIDTTVDSLPNPSTSFRTCLVNASLELMTDAETAGYPWCVWSRSTWGGLGTEIASFRDVVWGWVDNEFDTQRRREVLPATRTVWGTPIP